MDQVFNELSTASTSAQACLSDKFAVFKALYSLSKASTKLIEQGLSKQIRVTEDFMTRYFARDYSVIEWTYDTLTGRDHTVRSLLIGRFSASPHAEKLCQQEGVTELEQYHVKNISCSGLALAYLWGIPALSLMGNPDFTPPMVDIVYNFIDTMDEIAQETYSVGLVCEENDVSHHADAIRLVVHSILRDGQSLLMHAPDLLPYLVFSDVAREQLNNIDSTDYSFPRIRDILLELNRAMYDVEQKHMQRFNPKGFRFTPSESQTATTGENGARHTFTFSDNVQHLCEAHMRISASKRIYFKGIESSCKVYIGYVGEHLPTKKY